MVTARNMEDYEDGINLYRARHRPRYDEWETIAFLTAPVGSWHRQAACDNDDARGYADRWDVTTNRKTRYVTTFVWDFCLRCPVKDECLSEALDAEEGLPAQYRWGVRGGYTPLDRERMELKDQVA